MSKKPWVIAKYGAKTIGFGRQGGPAEFFYRSRGSWIKEDAKRCEIILNALNEADKEKPT